MQWSKYLLTEVHMFAAADLQSSDHNDLEFIDCARLMDSSYKFVVALQLRKLRLAWTTLQE